MTVADLGATVEFINFRPVFENQTVYRIVDWGSILCWILSFYKSADLLTMVKAMEMLPKGQSGIGSTASRNRIYNTRYVAYYRDTGLDLATKKKPKGPNLDWVREEIRKQDAKKKELQDLVTKTKGAN